LGRNKNNDMAKPRNAISIFILLTIATLYVYKQKNTTSYQENNIKNKFEKRINLSLPWIFAITPTYTRYTQKADLIRLSQTLMHVTNLHWILVEDSNNRTDLVCKLLLKSGLTFTHLNIPTPSYMKLDPAKKHYKPHRGLEQRNVALKWIRENVNITKTKGAVYFMDDDNTYHIKLFDEIRKINHVGIWPVGLTGKLRFAGPICSKEKVTGFRAVFAPNRLFPIDMAGFAISLRLLVKEKPDVIFESTWNIGWLETTFLKHLTSVDQLEALANDCTEILVWHTKTELPIVLLAKEQQFIEQGLPSDPNIEV